MLHQYCVFLTYNGLIIDKTATIIRHIRTIVPGIVYIPETIRTVNIGVIKPKNAASNSTVDNINAQKP